MSDLSAPLTKRNVRAAQPRATGRRYLPVARLAFAGIAVLLLAVALRIVLVETPDGGRPSAEVALNTSRDGNAIAGANATPIPGGIVTVGPEIPADEIPAALASEEAAEPEAGGAIAEAYGLVPDLVEASEYGPIPRMSATGETPFAAYARPSVSAATAGKPLIAIIVSGLGINVSSTLDAIATLPDTVTLAFAPYGGALERTVGSARAEGHEVYLEVPLEPFDYPENDPGPETLLTGVAPRDNMTKLYRILAKFGGYAGVINNMGARFTASGSDFGPMMEELGARGLAYLDDGSSNRSLAPQLASANRVPFRKADMVLDANPARAPILQKLAELEQQARSSGSAVGLIAALPVSVQTVAEWAKDLEERGFLLVPVSAVMVK